MFIHPEKNFLYIFFFILDTLALALILLVFTAPVGVFLNVFSNICYFVFLLVKHGPKKTLERLFKFKGETKKKNIKRIIKVFFGNFVPYVNI